MAEKQLSRRSECRLRLQVARRLAAAQQNELTSGSENTKGQRLQCTNILSDTESAVTCAGSSSGNTLSDTESTVSRCVSILPIPVGKVSVANAVLDLKW